MKRKVFITVKTYPTISTKYDELVCTAGILDDGSWVRVYPLPFRKLDDENRYKKYQWMELPLTKNTSDPRPESYKVTDLSKVVLLGDPIGTDRAWEDRRRIIFDKNPVYEDLAELIVKANHHNELSLAIFKPTKINGFKIEEVDREWDSDKLALLERKASQLSMFQSAEEVKAHFTAVPKLPFKFSYSFEDNKGKKSTLMIEDWEIGMLYWNCLKQTNNEQAAIQLVKEKYLDEFSNKDIFFFLGTTKEHHGRAKNPFVIVGVFYPPVMHQPSLF